MATYLYFVRHAESLFVEGKERSRGLSEKGSSDALIVRDILKTEEVNQFISSPYERAIATIRPSADEYQQTISIEEDLRERAIGDFTSETFMNAKYKVYSNFHFTFPNGESSATAQERAVKIINNILTVYEGKKVVIGTHGDIMTLILNYYAERFNYEFWESTSMPDIYKLQFEKKKLINFFRMWKP